MKQIPHLDDLFSPEYYHEIEGFESRIAVLKLNDVRETLGDCATSLIYSNCKEQEGIKNVMERNIIRRFHVRHAIVDLNNCYDLILQVPWFFYRAWEDFNAGGVHHNPRDRHYIEIIRNSDNWVDDAEKDCNESRVLKFLSSQLDMNLNQLATEYSNFKNEFIFNENKPFTIRTLANSMKHNSSLKIKELREPWTFTLKSQEKTVKPSDHNMSVEIKTKFFDLESGEDNTLGEIRSNYTDDLYIDIEYTNGELFRGIDYVRKNKHYPIDELYKEALEYYNDFIDLFEKTYSNIKPQLAESPILKKENEKDSTDSINLDKYFKVSE